MRTGAAAVARRHARHHRGLVRLQRAVRVMLESHGALHHGLEDVHRGQVHMQLSLVNVHHGQGYIRRGQGCGGGGLVHDAPGE